LAADGDERAISAFAEVGKWLGVAAGGLVNIFNPEIVLVGGGLSGAGDLILKPAREEASKRAYSQNWADTQLRIAGLRAESGLFGAAAYAMRLGRSVEGRDN
jgi:glucokinase